MKIIYRQNEKGRRIYITPIKYLEISVGIKETERIDTEIFPDSLGIINIDKHIGKPDGVIFSIL